MSGSKIDLGLGSLDDFKPSERVSAPSPTADERRALDETSRAHGFTKTSNPAVLPRRQRRGTGEQLHQLNVRGPISVMSRFIAFCDEERLAYWEALDRLLAERNR